MEEIRHVVVFRDPDRYAGWPANYGIWAWGEEIVSGFTLGFPNLDGGFHSRDKNRPLITMQCRSYDGGNSWISDVAPLLAPGGGSISAEEHTNETYGPVAGGVHPPVTHPGDIDFGSPYFAMLLGRTGLLTGAESWFYTSNDKCVTWQGPFRLPMFDQLGIAARTDYFVNPDSGANRLSLFLTATKPDGGEGRIFYAQSETGGKEFRFVSWLREYPEGFDIMPSSVKLPSGTILTAVRCRTKGGDKDYIDLFESQDNGLSWSLIANPVPDTGIGGNPPVLLRFADGRLCLVFGYRNPPFGIYAVLSLDSGLSWSDPVPLRTGGGNHDIGYPRAVQRSDGAVVIVYYFNDRAKSERYIAATIWHPRDL
jgi:hypothetical protein